MGCGCNKRTAGPRTAKYQYTAPDGTTQDVVTEVEARLLVARGGGKYDPKVAQPASS